MRRVTIPVYAYSFIPPWHIGTVHVIARMGGKIDERDREIGEREREERWEWCGTRARASLKHHDSEG